MDPQRKPRGELDPFANLANYAEVEGFINEAVSAFKDARTSAWRFFVLHEESQIRNISAARIRLRKAQLRSPNDQ